MDNIAPGSMKEIKLPILSTTDILEVLPELLSALKRRNTEWHVIHVVKGEYTTYIAIQYTTDNK